MLSSFNGWWRNHKTFLSFGLLYCVVRKNINNVWLRIKTSLPWKSYSLPSRIITVVYEIEKTKKQQISDALTGLIDTESSPRDVGKPWFLQTNAIYRLQYHEWTNSVSINRWSPDCIHFTLWFRPLSQRLWMLSLPKKTTWFGFWYLSSSISALI